MENTWSFHQASAGDESDEASLRPQRLGEFIGQSRVQANLRVFIDACMQRGDALDHLLFSGLPGLGKTTLAAIVAHELGARFHSTSGPALEKAYDIVGPLTKLEQGDVLFIDEIHRLSRPIEEYLYTAMEDRQIDLVIDKGPGARSVKLELKPFTLIGATTREGLLSAPLRARFGVLERLEPYADAELVEIANRTAGILQIGVDSEAAALVAARSRGTPRVVNRLLRRLRDFAQVDGRDAIDAALAALGLERLGIDALGLEPLDRQVLKVLADASVAVGLKTIVAAVGEEERTIEDVYEPHLLRSGFVMKTPRGRTITDRGRTAIGLPPFDEGAKTASLF